METTTTAAASAPTPVVFKSLTKSKETGDMPVLKMTHFSIQYNNSDDRGGYYLLVSDNDPSRPLRLYPSAMTKLRNLLDFAFSEAKSLEAQSPPDNENYDCGTINSYGSMAVRLVLCTYRGKVHVWLRLYSVNDNDEYLPTKTAVRFSTKDNITALENFLASNNNN